MTQLIAYLSTGKGSWSQLSKLISSYKWDKVFLLTNQFGKDKYSPLNNTELIVLDLEKDTKTLQEKIYASIKGKVSGAEVAINLTSGSGKEHMALITSVLKLGVGLRFVDYINNKCEEL